MNKDEDFKTDFAGVTLKEILEGMKIFYDEKFMKRDPKNRKHEKEN